MVYRRPAYTGGTQDQKKEKEILARRPALKAAIEVYADPLETLERRAEAKAEIDQICRANRKTLGIVWPEDRASVRRA